MTSAMLEKLIRENAIEINRLFARADEAWKHRLESEETRRQWEQASSEALHRHSQLSFPGGYEGALSRLDEGDIATIDAALTFLEIRPYFFRSGYMWKDLLQRCKRISMNESQIERFAIIQAKAAAWKASRSSREQS